MSLTEENKKTIMTALINNLTRITDKEYQQRIWIKCAGPEWEDFDEVVCQFFDIARPLLDDYKIFNITKKQHNLLKTFMTIFADFCNNNDCPEEFIDTPEWDNITKLAQEVLIAFNYQKDS